MRRAFVLQLFIQLTLLFLVSLSHANASEVFLYLNFGKSGKVYRVLTDFELRRPVGYFYECGPSEAFYVDNLKDFRMLHFAEESSCEASKDNIYRQVFTGSIAEADFDGTSCQYQDRREQLVKNSIAMPVYRPIGAPFSCGSGKLVKIPEESLATGEVQVLPDKNWYEIPNGSWYQTWHRSTKSGRESFLIYYDRWEKISTGVLEGFWRGEKPGWVMDKKVGVVQNNQLLRAIVSGILEPLSETESPSVVCSKAEKFSWFFSPGASQDRGELAIYTWQDDKPGKLTVSGAKVRYPVAVESKEVSLRFVGLGNSVALVIGTDIVRKWLEKQENKETDSKIDCSLVAFLASSLTNSVEIAVYSAGNSTIYFFNYDETRSEVISGVKKIPLNFKPDAFLFDVAGNLLIAAHEQSETVIFPDIEPGYDIETMNFDVSATGEFSETDGKFVSSAVPEILTGKIVFSRSFKESVYVCERNDSSPRLVNSVSLDKEYFFRDFELNKPPKSIFSSTYAEVIQLAKKPGNRLSELKKNVPGFPDGYIKPEKVYLGFYQN